MQLFLAGVNILLNIIQVLIFARVIVSWFRLKPTNPIMQILYQLTEPILEPIRKLLAKSSIGGGNMTLDFSPIIAFLLIGVLRSILFRIFM